MPLVIPYPSQFQGSGSILCQSIGTSTIYEPELARITLIYATSYPLPITISRLRLDLVPVHRHIQHRDPLLNRVPESAGQAADGLLLRLSALYRLRQEERQSARTQVGTN